jgi:hypothetical protein
MIAQQMQIAGGGYALPPVRNCGHPYPAIYDLEEYPKGYVILKFRVFSGEGNKDLAKLITEGFHHSGTTLGALCSLVWEHWRE